MIGPLLRAELLKIASTRLWWGLLIPVVLLSLLINAFGGLLTSFAAESTADVAQLPLLAGSLAYGLGLAVLFAAVHGTIVTAGEFRHRTATTTYLAGPRRGAVLLAKMAATALVGAGYALVSVAVGLVGGLLGQGDTRFPDAGLLLALAGIGVVVCALWSALGAALGTVLSNQVAVLVSVLIYLLFGEGLLSLLLGAADQRPVQQVTAYLPGNAGDVALYDLPATAIGGPEFGAGIVSGFAGVTDPLPWWGALLVLAAWTAAAGVAGWWVGARRDVT